MMSDRENNMLRVLTHTTWRFYMWLGIFGVVEGLGGRADREERCRQPNRAKCVAVLHGFPLVIDSIVGLAL